MKQKTASIAAVIALVAGGATVCGGGDAEVAPSPTLTGMEGVSPPRPPRRRRRRES